MVFKNSFINTLDNSGVQYVKILNISGSKSIIHPCSLLTVVIKKVVSNKKLKKGQVCKGLVVRLVKPIIRFNQISVKYLRNCIVILKKTELIPIGTRIFGSVFFEARKKKLIKIISLAAFII